MTTPEPDGQAAPKPEVRHGLTARLMARLRTYLIAGILVTAPVGLTFWMVWAGITFVDRLVTPLVPVAYRPETYLPFSVPGLGVIIVVVGLVLIGALTAGLVGRMVLRLSDRIVARMPIVRSIYGTLKQIFETVFAAKSKAFRQVVLVEYPRRGVWAIGFLTGETEGEVQAQTEDPVVNIFLPTTPNPTSGFLLFLPMSEVRVVSMTVEEGIRMVMSGGIVAPPDRRPAGERGMPSQTLADRNASGATNRP